MKKIILASTSPKRQELMSLFGLPIDFVSPEYEEPQYDPVQGKSIAEFTKKLALQKVLSVKQSQANTIIISADSLVEVEGEAVGKVSKHEFQRVLERLSGKGHSVHTGIALLDTSRKQVINEVISTKVFFQQLSESEILRYIQTGESFGKAGAYSLSQQAKQLLERIEGSYSNVLGLPLDAVAQGLQSLGVDIKIDSQQVMQEKYGVDEYDFRMTLPALKSELISNPPAGGLITTT